MEAIKTRRAIVLQDTIDYYSQNPEERRCKNNDWCFYSPKTVGKEETSEGCAIGRLLSPKLQEELDKNYKGSGMKDSIFSILPQEIQDLGQDFLWRLQSLHDIDDNWNSEGLTKKGERRAKQIEKNFCI